VFIYQFTKIGINYSLILHPIFGSHFLSLEDIKLTNWTVTSWQLISWLWHFLLVSQSQKPAVGPFP